MNDESLIIHKLAEGIISLNSKKFPDKILNIAKRCLIDISGVTLAGSSIESSKKLFEVASRTYAKGNSHILGHRKSINPCGASFINGTAAHALDFDDNCYAGIVHGSAVIFPAVLAFAQQNSLTGADLLKGFIIGLEVEFATAKALSNSIYDKGWWTTSVLGSIGSTAGVASIANIDIEKMKNALSLAIAGIGAVRAVRGTNAKHYYCGKAAESGIMSVNLAKQGITGPLDVFEDRNGIISVINNGIFDVSLLNNLGKNFSLIDPGIDIKKYPVCYASHSAADAVKHIIVSKKITIDSIDEIICIVPPVIVSNLTYSNPKTIKEAQFSMEFAISSILKYGDITLKNLDDEVFLTEDIQFLMTKVKVIEEKYPSNKVPKDKISPEWSSVKIKTKNGEFHELFVGAPYGSSINPISDKDLYNKFSDCLKYSKTKINPKSLFQKIKNIETLLNIDTLYR